MGFSIILIHVFHFLEFSILLCSKYYTDILLYDTSWSNPHTYSMPVFMICSRLYHIMYHKCRVVLTMPYLAFGDSISSIGVHTHTWTQVHPPQAKHMNLWWLGLLICFNMISEHQNIDFFESIPSVIHYSFVFKFHGREESVTAFKSQNCWLCIIVSY